MKYCPSCKTEKDKTEFYVRRQAADGLSYTCTDCIKAKARAHYIPRLRQTTKAKTYREYLRDAGMEEYFKKVRSLGLLEG